MPRDPRLLACLVIVACGGAPPGSAAPRRCAEYRTLWVPQSIRYQLDLLLVVDSGPAMALAQPALARRLAALLSPFDHLRQRGSVVDLQLGVLSAEPGPALGRLRRQGTAAPAGCRSPTDGAILRYRFDPAGDRHNLPAGQSLGQTVACMAAAGAQGGREQHLLEAAYQAIHRPGPEAAGLVRDDALLALLLITNGDDGAPDPGRYVDFFTTPAIAGGAKANPLDVVMLARDGASTTAGTLVAASGPPGGPQHLCTDQEVRRGAGCERQQPRACQNPSAQLFADPAPRLNAVVESVLQHGHTSFCDDGGGELDSLARVVVSDDGGGCIPDPLPYDPAAPWRLAEEPTAEEQTQHPDGVVTRRALASCQQGLGLPCWSLVQAPWCAALSPDGLALRIARGGADAPPHTTVLFTYATRCADDP